MPANERVALDNAVAKLQALGLALGYPHSSAVQSGAGLRELRPRAGRSPWRGLYRRVGDRFVLAAVAPEAQHDRRGFARLHRSGEATEGARGVTIMVKLSELTTAEEIHDRDMADPAYRAEYERTKFANDVAIRVLRYRAEHSLTQTAFGRLVGMRQPHVARLEAGEHEPSLSTLVRLSAALGVDFTVDINPAGAQLRESA